jgi:enoyl-CoA hydratase/carnithine racemase
VLPAEQLIAAAVAYSDEMAASVAPRAVATIKRQIYGHLSAPFEEAARETDALVRQSVTHPDAKEGAVSFVERRPPRFSAWTGQDA